MYSSDDEECAIPVRCGRVGMGEAVVGGVGQPHEVMLHHNLGVLAFARGFAPGIHALNSRRARRANNAKEAASTWTCWPGQAVVGTP